MSNQEVFLKLVRAGLWKEEVRLESFGIIDFDKIRRLAEEQSVVGLVTAGLEKLPAGKLPLTEKLKFAGLSQLVEQRNLAMNRFLVELVEKIRNAGINTILLKGQGVAQCYERPLWRSCGDVDFLLDDVNYEKAKAFLTPFADSVEIEDVYCKHIGMTYGAWTLELHGSLHTELSVRIDNKLDEIQKDTFVSGEKRIWNNEGIKISLPPVDDDIIFVFTHFLKHFYKGGLGLRQICDWCRLLWSYGKEIDVAKLEKRLREMRLVTEWKAFGAFAVERLGMPVEAMPLYEGSNRWSLKARRIEEFVMMSGNFGHNRDLSYWIKYPYLIRKTFSMKRRVGDLIRHARIFPQNSLRFLPNIVINGLKAVMKGL